SSLRSAASGSLAISQQQPQPATLPVNLANYDSDSNGADNNGEYSSPTVPLLSGRQHAFRIRFSPSSERFDKLNDAEDAEGSGLCCSCCFRRFRHRRPDLFCVCFCIATLLGYLVLSSVHFWLPYSCTAIFSWFKRPPNSTTAGSSEPMCAWQLQLAYSASINCLQFGLALTCQGCLLWFCRQMTRSGYLSVARCCLRYARLPFYTCACFTAGLSAMLSFSASLCPIGGGDSSTGSACLGPLYPQHLVMLVVACESLVYSCLLLWLLRRLRQSVAASPQPDAYSEGHQQLADAAETEPDDPFGSFTTSTGGKLSVADVGLSSSSSSTVLNRQHSQQQPHPMDELLARQASLIGYLRLRNNRLTRRVYRVEQELMHRQRELLDQQSLSHVGLGFGRAGLIVARVAADYKWSLSGLVPDSPEYAAVIAEVHERSANRLHRLCCVNRGCFVKVGQHLAALNYLLPEPYTRVLGRLHSDAPASNIEEVRQVIEEDFGRPAHSIFRSIDPSPCGAASLAQVHRAELLDGTPVAVKVQHPDVLARSAADMATMDWLVGLVSRLFVDFHFQWLVDETRRNLPRELDFAAEAENMRLARRLYCGRFPWLEVPGAVAGLVSKRVLVMELCRGGQIDDLAYISSNRLDRRQIVKQLTPDFRLSYCRLWRAIIDGDLAGIRASADSLGCGHLYGLFACMVSGRSWRAVSAGVSRSEFSTEEELSEAGRLLPQMTQVLESVPRQMLLLFKANDLLRGIEHRLTGRQRFGPGLSFTLLTDACLRTLAEASWAAADWRDWLRLRCRLCLIRALLIVRDLWAAAAASVESA
uniref:ABC1 domain-containing protein n=1 Tax=Macrostomum lignano TaxID=282301 RepID=A0A1I8HDE2_9PLAT